jgi:hypothetical protein
MKLFLKTFKNFLILSKTENFDKLLEIEKNQLVNIMKKNAIVDE